MKTTISFTLDDDQDRDLVRWLRNLPKRERSRAIRQALRDHLGRNGVTLREVYEAVMALKRAGVRVTEAEDAPEQNEPDDITAALDTLGL